MTQFSERKSPPMACARTEKGSLRTLFAEGRSNNTNGVRKGERFHSEKGNVLFPYDVAEKGRKVLSSEPEGKRKEGGTSRMADGAES